MTETSINKSLLNNNNFRLLIDKVPTVEYYVQSVNIPSMVFLESMMPTRVGIDAYFPGDKVTFSNLSVTFLVDEDLENYKEMYDWMNAIVPISDSADYKDYVNTSTLTTGELSNINNDLIQYSQITLVTNTNKNLPNKFFRFYDCFPVGLGEIELKSGSESETVTCTAEFRFTYFDINTTS